MSSLTTRRTASAAMCSHSGFITELLSHTGQGDQEAFGRLVTLFAPAIAAATSARVSPPELDMAVHEIFLAIWREAPNYQPGEATAVEWIMQFAAA
jgi:DNA-directed RNA polymerase specialized sigma24 family protein